MMEPEGQEEQLFEAPPQFEGIPINEKFRQHKIKVFEEVFNSVVIATIIIVFLFTILAGIEDPNSMKYAIIISSALFFGIVLSVLWISYWRWKKTMILFKETEMTVFRDTVFKKEIRIAYTKIASVNVNRGIINRLTGTSKLLININSRVNSYSPELTLTFSVEMADRIRANLSKKMYNNNVLPADEDNIPSIVTITAKDVVLHSFLSQPTASALFGIIMFFIGFYQMFTNSGDFGAGVVAIFFAAITYVIPVVAMIFHYFNYKIYRIGDTIYLSHGLIRTYHKSFKITRINAVRLRSPLLPRLVGRYMLDAEVVGLALGGNDDSKNIAPLLCPMKDRGTIDRVMKAIVPEFIYDVEMDLQPKEAAKPIFIRAALWSIFVVIIAVAFYDPLAKIFVDEGMIVNQITSILIVLSAIIIVSIFINGIWSCRIVEYGRSTDLFTFVVGVIDRKITIMSYDKVQIVKVESGPFSRPYGLAKCNISLLSSMGSQNIYSGYFNVDELEAISDEVISRVKDGRYNYREYL